MTKTHLDQILGAERKRVHVQDRIVDVVAVDVLGDEESEQKEGMHVN